MRCAQAVRALAWLCTLAALWTGGCKRAEGGSAKDKGAAASADTTCSCQAPAASAPAPAVPATPAHGAPMSFASLAKAADPGVVTIRSRAERTTARGNRRSFSQGVGTGFVYEAVQDKVLVLTNHHVVEGATEILVQFADGQTVGATIRGADRHTDIAVVEVPWGQGIRPLTLGDSDALQVGDWVVAIGNPFGLSHTVSAGILSGKGRTRDDVQGLDPSGYFNFLQTDAAINQGNSGGPLLDLAGRVVGINTAIRANANNIGFAIPINMVKQMLEPLLKHGKLVRSALGILVQELDAESDKPRSRAAKQGALVAEVSPGSAADRAGIRAGDIVLEFDSKPIGDPNMLRWLASMAGVGNKVPVKLKRGVREFNVTVTLQALDEQP